MFKNYNAHPKKLKVGDCTVRAISTAKEIDYLECRRDLNRVKNELGFPSYKDTAFLYEYLKEYPRFIYKAVKGEPRLKAAGFTELHPKGKYVLKLRGHLVACIDGIIMDTWDCSHLTVYTAWHISN